MTSSTTRSTSGQPVDPAQVDAAPSEQSEGAPAPAPQPVARKAAAKAAPAKAAKAKAGAGKAPAAVPGEGPTAAELAADEADHQDADLEADTPSTSGSLDVAVLAAADPALAAAAAGATVAGAAEEEDDEDDEDDDSPKAKSDDDDDDDPKPLAAEGEVGISTDLVRAYLKEIGKVPLLTAEQEVELAQRIEAGLFAAEKMR